MPAIFNLLLVLVLVTFTYSLAAELTLRSQHVSINFPATTLHKGFFDISYLEQVWFHSEDVFVRHLGQQFSTVDGTLTVLSLPTDIKHGHDKVYGVYEEVELSFGLPKTSENNKKGELLMIGKVRLYSSDHVVFEQHFPQTLFHTSSYDADALITSFPSFHVKENDAGQGFAQWISWNYDNLNSTSASTLTQPTPSTTEVTTHNDVHRRTLVAPGFISPQIASWNTQSMLLGGIAGSGVNVVFDPTGKVTATTSALTNPMVVSHISPQPGVLQYGIMGNVTMIPHDFSIQILLSFHNAGITAGVDKWGSLLRQWYKKPSATIARTRDITLQYLGYTTDNGAFYYYHTLPNLNYEDTLLALFKYTQKVGLPYKYILLDSWWYYKGSNGGVSQWTPQTALFPHGLQYLYEQTNWFIQAHNRYWALDNVYSSSHEGNYTFIDDEVKNGSVPMDPHFWTDLLHIPSQSWGLKVYEQDWLFNEFYQYVSAMLTDVFVAKTWLTQMAQGATENDVTIQYCMPFIRHLLQSVEFEVVTQARASDDYVVSPYEGNPNWRIGGQNMIIDALGMAPSKDGFWSSHYQPGNPYGEERYEPCPRLQAAVTALSAGPFAIADGIGYSDVDLIMRACMKDGRLLQPSIPAKMIDALFVEAVVQSGKGPVGDVWFAASLPNVATEKNAVFGSVFVANLQSTWSLFPTDIGYGNSSQFYVSESNHSLAVALFSQTAPLTLKACAASDFQLYSISPIFSNGWTLLGETNKWVPVSAARFTEITPLFGENTGIIATMQGVPEEVITVGFVDPAGKSFEVSCTFAKDQQVLQLDSFGNCK